MTSFKTVILCLSLILAIGLTFGSFCSKVSADEQGEAIMASVRDHKHTPATYMVKGRMTLKDKSGNTTKRKFLMMGKRTAKGTLTRITLTSPPEVKGMGFLIRKFQGQQVRRYLYLPALKVTLEVIGSESNGTFADSDIRYEDLSTDYFYWPTHHYLRKEDCDGRTCSVVESLPLPRTETISSRVVIWVDNECQLPLKIEVYDRSGKLSRTIRALNLKRIGSCWRIVQSETETEATGHRTLLKFTSGTYNIELPDALFTPEALQQFPVIEEENEKEEE